MEKQTFIIGFISKKNKIDKQELKRIKTLETLIEYTLMFLTYDVLGLYEGYDIVENEYRMFISCTNVDKLEEILNPFLKKIDWSPSIYFIKKYGEMNDTEAKAEYIDIY